MCRDSPSVPARTVTRSAQDGVRQAPVARKGALRPRTTVRKLEKLRVHSRLDRIDSGTPRLLPAETLAPSP